LRKGELITSYLKKEKKRVEKGRGEKEGGSAINTDYMENERYFLREEKS